MTGGYGAIGYIGSSPRYPLEAEGCDPWLLSLLGALSSSVVLLRSPPGPSARSPAYNKEINNCGPYVFTLYLAAFAPGLENAPHLRVCLGESLLRCQLAGGGLAISFPMSPLLKISAIAALVCPG